MPELAQVVVDFVDAHLLGKPGAIDRLAIDGNVPGKLRLE
jgi:hypothetical protein